MAPKKKKWGDRMREKSEVNFRTGVEKKKNGPKRVVTITVKKYLCSKERRRIR